MSSRCRNRRCTAECRARAVARARPKASVLPRITALSVISIVIAFGREFVAPQLADDVGLDVRLEQLATERFTCMRRLGLPGLLLPRAQRARGLGDHEPADRHDQPDFFRERNELRRKHFTARRPPAHERFEARDRAVGQPHDRLIVDAELFGLDRRAQAARKREPARRFVEHVLLRSTRSARGRGPWRDTSPHRRG